MTDETTMENNTSDDVSERLLAGKYKTPEALEEGYGNLYKESQSVYQKSKDLEKKLADVTSVPDAYHIPSDLNLNETQLNDLKEMARESGMNQSQFNNAINRVNKTATGKQEAFESRKKEIGEEKLNVVKGFVDGKYADYGDAFRENMYSNLIKDDKAMSEAMKERDAQLNSKAPAVENTSAYKAQVVDGQRDCYEAGLRAKANPNDARARDKYINLCREVGNERFKNMNR